VSTTRPLLCLAAAVFFAASCAPINDDIPIDLDITELDFAEPNTWARPILDYIEAAEDAGYENFETAIHAMAVFEDSLYIGYGDATLNLGRIFPIEPRYWVDPSTPDDVRADFVLDEEQIHRYRLGHDRLLVPGTDATKDAWIGNAYQLVEGEQWTKSRTLIDALHVQDIGMIDDIIYACGSGADQPNYNEGLISAQLWRSSDGGLEYELVDGIQNPLAPRDTRFTNLLVLDGELYLFGYQLDFDSQIGAFPAYKLSADELVEVGGFTQVFVNFTQSLTKSTGIIAGVDVAGTVRNKTWRFSADGLESMRSMDGRTLIATAPTDDGRTLFLYYQTNTYPIPTQGPWDIGVAITSDGRELSVLLNTTIDRMPTSLAWWRGGIYIGLETGRVVRSVGRVPN